MSTLTFSFELFITVSARELSNIRMTEMRKNRLNKISTVVIVIEFSCLSSSHVYLRQSVLLQFIFRFEILSTFQTHETHRCMNDFNVLTNGRISRKLFATVWTLVNAIDHMYFDMQLEFHGVLISLRTKWAFVKSVHGTRAMCFDMH